MGEVVHTYHSSVWTLYRFKCAFGLNSHSFPMVGIVINPIVGSYIRTIRIPTKGGMTIPNVGSLDPATKDVEPFFKGFLVDVSGVPVFLLLEHTACLSGISRQWNG